MGGCVQVRLNVSFRVDLNGLRELSLGQAHVHLAIAASTASAVRPETLTERGGVRLVCAAASRQNKRTRKHWSRVPIPKTVIVCLRESRLAKVKGVCTSKMRFSSRLSCWASDKGALSGTHIVWVCHVLAAEAAPRLLPSGVRSDGHGRHIYVANSELKLNYMSTYTHKACKI